MDGGLAAGGNSADFYPNYEKELGRCTDFLENYKTPSVNGAPGELKYLNILLAVQRRETVRVDIDLSDVLIESGADLVRDIQGNAKRYQELFSKAIDKLLPAPAMEAVQEDADAYDVLMIHRVHEMQQDLRTQNPDAVQGDLNTRAIFPAGLYRRYEVRFLPTDSDAVLSLRQVRAGLLGTLVTVKCIVIRASDIKPLVTVATYSCDECGREVYQEVKGKTWMPLAQCPSDICKANKSSGKLSQQTRGSRFVSYQELRVQELPEQVPVGHIPRSMTIIARGEATRECVPGDIVEVTGVFLPTPFSGFQAMRAGLTADTYLEAHSVVKAKKAVESHVDGDVEAAIRAVSDNDPYTTLSRSIAPEIYGLEDAKKALLLQLVGGVTQTQADGMRTRGDINVCLMGDPGVAKSQLLKHIHKLAPRAVYTTGKGSSGVGLTAAVVKDPLTGELALEGGALVLADMGICCIDEFDKMEEGDRTAIHEVMEQQTVSIAKAGITTTLNARTAILAAANPKYGRYNRRADPDASVAMLKNINLPAALLSRFDLLFLLLDEVDGDNDRALAAHITYVHQREEHPPLDFTPHSPAFIRQYVSVCKHINPHVPRELSSYIVEAYVDMRQAEKERAGKTGGRGSMTARQLLSILRLAQALARLELRLEVTARDVDEAIRLVTMSKASVLDAGEGKERVIDADPLSRGWAILRPRLQRDPNGSVPYETARQLCVGAGLSEEQFRDMLVHHEQMGLLSVNPSGTLIFSLVSAQTDAAAAQLEAHPLL